MRPGRLPPEDPLEQWARSQLQVRSFQAEPAPVPQAPQPAPVVVAPTPAPQPAPMVPAPVPAPEPRRPRKPERWR